MGIWIVIFLLLTAVLILSIRLYLIQNDLSIFKRDLERFDGSDYRKSLSLSSGIKGMEELAATINNKTRELNEAVVHYRKMEDELKISIANMSHDLRTPLTSILGYLQLLKNEVSTKDGIEYMEVMQRRAKTLETLINDFFEISIIETRQFPIAIEAVDLEALLVQQIADMYDSFKSRGIEPQIDITGHPVRILGDKNALNRIIANLLANALKHSLAGLWIKLGRDDKQAYLEISNYTENLSQEDMKRIFDRFYMADKVRNGQGSGLGLPIVKTLVEKMDGTVTANLKDGLLTLRVAFRAC
ncbi:MAG TPA: HAMP domain-containing sensor histidine kinase [Clostridia bacterium]|nr:HAMP domain-containing sensor histidine kinase [Clostridia bacterium]